MLSVNTYFPDLSPVTAYLDALELVTEVPTETTIAELQAADKTLTDQAVLFPYRKYVHGEGYRTFGFEPCPISDGVTALARLALHEPGSPEYDEEYAQLISGPPRPDAASEENRRRSARGALIVLGGKLAVSGALFEREIEPAYAAIRKSMDVIGGHDEAFTNFGLDRIRRDLFTEYARLRQSGPYENPIGNTEAKRNIRAAWNAVGRPYGKFTRLFAALS